MRFHMAVRIAAAAALLAVSGITEGAETQSTPWIGTWATAPQPFMPGTLQTYNRQTLRLIVHTSIGGSRLRITISNLYGDTPLHISDVHVAVRTVGANIDPNSDRVLLFQGQAKAILVGAHTQITSDAVNTSVPALSDLAVSFYLPQKVDATTSHLLALQTSYVAAGNSSSAAQFPVEKTIDTWPFLTGVDIDTPTHASAIAIIGSSTTDGDGSTLDHNQRWPDGLARHLQEAGGTSAALGVLNLGIIGNRLLKDSPQQVNPQLHGSRASTYWNPHAQHGGGDSNESPFGLGLGEAVLTRFERDVLSQSGVKYLVIAIGVNDIVFPGSFTPPSEAVKPQELIEAYRQLIHRAHDKGIRVIGTTIPPFENSFYPEDKTLVFFTPEKERTRQIVNDWIRASKEFDGVADFDAVLRDPAHPARLLERFDSGDHLHSNDAGYQATSAAVPLPFFSMP